VPPRPASTRFALVTAILLAFVARADPPGPLRPAEDAASIDRRIRVMALVDLAENLGLAEAEALQLWERLKPFEARRTKAMQELVEASARLELAAAGDKAAIAEVEAQVTRLAEAKVALLTIDREVYANLAAKAPPEKRAKLALVINRLAGTRMWMRTRGGRPDEGRPH
jgi:DNA repair exonuclease SbcCD ATPase subunit